MVSGSLRYTKQSVVVPAPSYSRPAPVENPFDSTNAPWAAPVAPPAAPPPPVQPYAAPAPPMQTTLPPAQTPVRLESRAPAQPLFDWKVSLLTTLGLIVVGGIVALIAR